MATLKHIAIAGNIGSGKTTLAEKLSKHYNWIPLYESVDHNPYLRDFYEDMTRWAYHLQIYFLNSRFNQVRQIRESEKTIGHLNNRDYQSYLDLFNSMTSFVQPPDLLIYLKADIPKLVQQIQKRNRDFEFNIKLEYLKTLNEHYEKWIAGYKHGKLLTIDVNKLDFVENTEDFSMIVGRVDLELNSLFG